MHVGENFFQLSSSQDTSSMLSKLKCVREFCFCFIQFEVSHNLYLPFISSSSSMCLVQNEQITSGLMAGNYLTGLAVTMVVQPTHLILGGRVGLVMRALAFHQCGPGLIFALGVICGLSLLVLYSAMRGFSPGCSGFPLSSKTNI